MYEVSDDIRTLLKRGGVLKYLKITLADSGNVIPYSNIGSESLEFRQSIWNGDDFKFGGCISSYLKFRTLDYAEDILDKKIKAEIVIPNLDGILYDRNKNALIDSSGKELRVEDTDYTSDYSGEEIDYFVSQMSDNTVPAAAESAFALSDTGSVLCVIPLGVFIVESNELEENGVVRDVTAYDELYSKRNVNVYELYTGVLAPRAGFDGTFTSAYGLLMDVCSCLNLEYENDLRYATGILALMSSDINFTTSNLYLTGSGSSWKFNKNDWQATKVLRDLFESVCSFGVINRDGKLSCVRRNRNDYVGGYGYSEAVETYMPNMLHHNSIKLSDALRPMQARVYETTYDNCAYLYEVPQCTVYPDENSTNNPGGLSKLNIPPRCYAMKSNISIRAKWGLVTLESGQSYNTGRNLPDIAGVAYILTSEFIPYKNFKATAVGLPYIDAGDVVTVCIGGNEIKVMIASRTLKGIVNMTDTFETRFPSEYEQLTYSNMWTNNRS